MNWFRVLGVIVLSGVAAICDAADQSASMADKCNYQSNPGTEIVFAEQQTTGYEGDKYTAFYPASNSAKGPVVYEDYVGKHAKVDDKTSLGGDNVEYYRKVTTEDCQIVFLQTGIVDTSDESMPNPFRPLGDLADESHFYLVSDFNVAQRLIGHIVWIKRPTAQTAPYPDDDPFIEKSLRNLDAVKVLQVDLKNHGQSWETPIKLLVETPAKKQGLINYGGRFVYTENPMSGKWSRQVLEAIRTNRVFVGMSEQQARLSWGEPSHVNTTTGAAVREEQWVYGSSGYLYFTDGRLSNVQTSH